MSECKRCGKKNVDIHTCSPKKYRSKCCNAKCYAVGGHFRLDMDTAVKDKSLDHVTFHAQCDKCKEPCDIL